MPCTWKVVNRRKNLLASWKLSYSEMENDRPWELKFWKLTLMAEPTLNSVSMPLFCLIFIHTQEEVTKPVWLSACLPTVTLLYVLIALWILCPKLSGSILSIATRPRSKRTSLWMSGPPSASPWCTKRRCTDSSMTRNWPALSSR